MSAKIIVTNNDQVREFFNSFDLTSYYHLHWVEGDTLAVLTHVRNICHSGGTLLTHPLSGSIKPNQTPFKTVVLSRTEKVDTVSVMLAEGSLHKARDLSGSSPAPTIAQPALEDLRTIDLELFKSYLQTAAPIR